ncbi:MAG: phage major capsid protein [Rubrivivax sp.]|nr:phage major capsid protein [Rubrivivax sp.]
MQRRDMTKAGVSGSQYLVGTELAGFASALDAASVLGRLPVTRLPNMIGDATITRESVKGSATWLSGEAAVIGDAQPTMGAIALAPKIVSGLVTASRLLLTQAGPAGNAFIEKSLATTVAEAVDRALISGSGNLGEPLGLAVTSGIDTRAGTAFALADAAAMLRVAEGYAGSDSVQWLAGVAAAEDLRTRVKTATYGNGYLMDERDRLLARPVVVSRSVGDQVLICMPWSQLWFASWGALEIGADPMTYFSTGKVMIRCLWSIDFAVERAASVAIATALT